jgi:hypothetical protein
MKYIIIILALFCCFSVNAQPRIIGANNVVTILAGEAIPNWSLVRVTAGKAWRASSTKIDSAAVAIAIDTAFAANDTIQVAYSGTLQGFAIEKGKDYFLGTGGTFTATKPTTIFTQKIGSWVEDSTLQLNIQQALPVVNTETFVSLPSDISNSTITLTDVTGLSFTAEANTSYVVRLYGFATFASAVTGIGLALNVPNDASVISGRVTNQIGSQTLSSMQQVQDDAIAGTTGTNGIGTSGNPAPVITTYIDGVWIVTTATGGTVQLRLRSELATNNVTVKAGSRISYLKI